MPIIFSMSFPLKRAHIIIVLVLMGLSAIIAIIIGYVGYQINSENTSVEHCASLIMLKLKSLGLVGT